MKDRGGGFLKVKWLVAFLFCFAKFQSALACATCYGKTDSALAAGMNWGIMTMILIIYSVLFSIIGFFIFTACRSATTKKANVTTKLHNPSCSKNS